MIILVGVVLVLGIILVVFFLRGLDWFEEKYLMAPVFILLVTWAAVTFLFHRNG